MTVATIEKLIRDDAEALALWTEATRREVGNPNRDSETGRLAPIVDNVHDRPPTKPQGNSREAALRRLNKLERPGGQLVFGASPKIDRTGPFLRTNRSNPL